MSDECRMYEVDGEPIRVQGGAPMSDAAQDALAEVVRATKRLMQAEKQPPDHVIGDIADLPRDANGLVTIPKSGLWRIGPGPSSTEAPDAD